MSSVMKCGHFSWFRQSSEFIPHDGEDEDAEGVGAADDFEQAASGEYFNEQAVSQQQAGVAEEFWVKLKF